MSIKEKISEYNPEAIIFDDIDDAIIGIGQQHGSRTVVIYDREKCIEIFFENFKKSKSEKKGRHLNDEELVEIRDEAIEWFEYNVECSYVGENTPIFLERL